MSLAPLALLKLLLPGVGGVSSGAASSRATTASGPDFAALLSSAQRGEVSTGLPVRLGRGCDVMLTGDQLSRLAVAADKAEAQGATRAVVLIDGQALRMDVGVREITGRADLLAGGGAVLTGIDAVISIPPAPSGEPATGVGASEPAPGVLPPPRPAAGSLNPSILELLTRMSSRSG
ncbi:MAG: hypothetical protein ACKVU4_09585 [Phycisphaerales bacterium]